MELIEKKSVENSQVENDLYDGYNDYNPYLDSKALQYDPSFQQAIRSSSYNNRRNRDELNSRNGFFISKKKLTNEFAIKTKTADASSNPTLNSSRTAKTSIGLNLSNSTRPVTAVRAAGYTRTLFRSTEKSENVIFNPSDQIHLVNSSNLNKTQDDFIEITKIKSLRNKIEILYQQSVLAAYSGNKKLALEKARSCILREKALSRIILNHQTQKSSIEPSDTIPTTYLPTLNVELKLSVQLNLAVQLTNNQLYNEALNLYENLVKNKKLLFSGRFKCNMAVIYFLQKKFRKAIKFFQMALDQLPNTQSDLRMKIMRNIALCFVSMAKYQDAASSFEYILSEKPLFTDAFRILICNYMLNDVNQMKNSFIKLLELRNHIFVNQSMNYKYNFLNQDSNQIEISSFLDLDLSDEEDLDLDEKQLLDQNFLNKNEDKNMNNKNNSIGTSFNKTISSSLSILNKINSTQVILSTEDHNAAFKQVLRNDVLSMIFSQKLKYRNWCILTASKLISNRIAQTYDQGFGWCSNCIQTVFNTSTEAKFKIKSSNLNLQTDKNFNLINDVISIDLIQNSMNFCKNRLFYELIVELKLACADYYLRARQFEPAIIILATFEHLGTIPSSNNSHLYNKIWTSRSTALTNLSYIHFLQRQFSSALKYCDIVLESDHYNIGALVNKGCCLLQEGQYEKSREYSSEALLHEPHSVQAIYNLAIANRRLGHLENALDLFLRLNTFLQNNEFCLYQIALIYEQLNEKNLALDCYEKLLSITPYDVTLLNRLSDLLESSNNKQQAFIHLNESIRQYPSHIPTIERLVVYFIEVKAYEKAINYLEQASKIQPNQIKWILMVAACYRRTGELRQAFQKYQSALIQFPESIDCLRNLINLSHDLKLNNEYEKYFEQLNQLEKMLDLREKFSQSASNLSQNKATANLFRTTSDKIFKNEISGQTNGATLDSSLASDNLLITLESQKLNSGSSLKSNSNPNAFQTYQLKQRSASLCSNSNLNLSLYNKDEKSNTNQFNQDNLEQKDLDEFSYLINSRTKTSNKTFEQEKKEINFNLDLNLLNFNNNIIHSRPMTSSKKKISSDHELIEEFQNEDIAQILP